MSNTNTPGSDHRLLINIFGSANVAVWQTPVEADDIIDGTLYFIARRPVNRHGVWVYHSELKNGKKLFTRKPGIAIQYYGSEAMRKALRSDATLCGLIVPADADKRWMARR